MILTKHNTIMLSVMVLTLLSSSILQNSAVGQLNDRSLIGNTPLLDANDDRADTNEDNLVVINVLKNDNYVGIDKPKVISTSAPSNGNTEINSDNTVTYTPDLNFFGSDSFTYTISDGNLGLLSDTATVMITVNPVNDLPVAVDDNITTDEDTPTSFFAEQNDFDVDGDEIFVASVEQGANGSAEISENGAVMYTPNPDFNGQDSFIYTLSDGNSGSDTATVMITVNPINDPPVANNDTAVTDEDTSIVIDILSNDSDIDNDALSILSVTQGTNGNTEINSDNTVTYTPNLNFFGSDSFTYALSDGNGGSDTATVMITVNSVTTITLEQVSSGLVAFDPLNNGTFTKEELKNDNRYWRYGGSAVGLNASFDLFQNSTGRYIGTQAPEPGTYAGYYAVAQSGASLFHAVITTPYQSIPSHFFQNGLYVQTDNGLINYVTCVSITSSAGTSWHLIRTFGDVNQATQFEVLWSDVSSNQPLTRDCTIITNGDNYLKLYMDNQMVYENNTLDLQMPAPFLYFLEPQNSYAGEMLYGIYKDYYATTGEIVTIVNLPPEATTVELQDDQGSALITSQVNNGTSELNVGSFHFPIQGIIKILDSAGTELISMQSNEIFGGDRYSVTSNP